MNFSPDLVASLRLLGWLALEVALLVTVAAGLSRLTASVPWRRIIWQGCLVGVVALTLAESSGIGRELGSRVKQTLTPAQREELPARSLAGTGAAAQPPAPAAVAETITLIGSPMPGEAVTPSHVRLDPMAAGTRLGSEFRFAPTPNLDALGLTLIWMAGAVWFLVRATMARLICWNLGWRHRCDSRDVTSDSIGVLADKLGIRRRVRLVESTRLRSPVAFGWWRPSIGIPAQLSAQFSRVQQEAMLSHELAHLAGRDPFWYCLADFTAAILWWHPLVWLARRRLRDASERAADDASLLVCNGPQALAECLVTLGLQLVDRPGVGVPRFEGTGFRSGLAQRVERLCRMRAGSWRPPGSIRSVLARTAAPTILVATIVVGTGWTRPSLINQGDPMKTIRHLWTQSVSALALLAATEPGVAAPALLPLPEKPPVALPAQTGASATTNRSSAALVEDATILYELGKFDEAEKRFNEALGAEPANREAVEHYLTLIQEKRYAQKTTTPRPASAENTSQPVVTPGGRAFGMDPVLMERYGLVPKGGGASSGTTPALDRKSNESVRSIQSRLDQIVFDEVRFESLPLTEVLKFLNEESRKREIKTGVNFLINPNPLPDPNPAISIDPTTGVPLAQSEPTDMSGVIVNFNLPLRNVRLTDVLNAIVKVADKPIQFSVEEYGVVFSPASGRAQAFAAPSTPHSSSMLAVRTFRVDTNMFMAGLESAFGISASNPVAGNGTADRSARSRDVQGALRKLMVQLGVNMDDPSKAVFYNDLTGVLMVRATPGDLELVEAAVETLGGASTGQSVPEAVGVPRVSDAQTARTSEEMRRRYGLLPANKASSNNLK